SYMGGTAYTPIIVRHPAITSTATFGACASGLRARIAFDVTREDRDRRRQLRAGGDPVSAAERKELPLLGRHGEEIEQLARRRRHERLGKHGDLADDLGGHVEHGPLPR